MGFGLVLLTLCVPELTKDPETLSDREVQMVCQIACVIGSCCIGAASYRLSCRE